MTAATTRRTALRTGLAGLAATIAAPALARTAAPEPDAQLIRHCCDLVAVTARREALEAERLPIADEVRTEPAMDQLRAEEDHVLDRIDGALPIKTLAGARALARAALAIAPRGPTGAVVYEFDLDFEWLAVSIAEFVAAQPG